MLVISFVFISLLPFACQWLERSIGSQYGFKLWNQLRYVWPITKLANTVDFDLPSCAHARGGLLWHQVA